MKSHILKETIFSIQKVTGASFLRQKNIKQLPKKLLIVGESIFQHISFLAEWAPSILLTLRKSADVAPQEFSDLNEMLICPICQKSLFKDGLDIKCDTGHAFDFKEGIVDLFIE
jgi:hypothetical protein